MVSRPRVTRAGTGASPTAGVAAATLIFSRGASAGRADTVATAATGRGDAVVTTATAGWALAGAGLEASTRIQYMVRSVSFWARSAADAAADGGITSCALAVVHAKAHASSTALSAILGSVMAILLD